MGEPSMINTGVLQGNPFPGSRPFFSAEDQFFFGRDKAVSELLEVLLQKRFVAMVGPSAVGKTSLIQSGIIPALLSDMKEEWVPVYIRPGRRPMESLVRGFQRVFSKKITEADVNTFLGSSKNIGDFLIEKGLGNYHYFLVVDQFEELFTWTVTTKKRKSGKNQDALVFINHLMRMVDEEKPRIFLMLSIRSEFLDYCSSYRGLSDQLERSKYIVPQMNRDELTEAILEPFRVAEATVETGFEKRLLNDLEDVEPKLPLLQHALNRTWDHWKSRGKSDQPVSLEDYLAKGPVRNGLNRDLENLYQSLEFYQKEICERIFKTIAFKTGSHEGFSRRTALGNIARIAQCNVDRVVEVVQIFDKAGHPFLGYQHAAPLSSESRIELSHESLITIWDRLHQWVDEEDESIRTYLKLSKISALYQQGKGALLEASELQKALEWKKLHNPTPAWGIQFDPAFERAMVFLNTSEEEYIWSEKRKIILQRRRRILNRAIIFGTVVIAAAVALVIYISKNKPVEPDQQVQTVIQEPNPLPTQQLPDTERPLLTEEQVPQDREDVRTEQAVESTNIQTIAEQEEPEVAVETTTSQNADNSITKPEPVITLRSEEDILLTIAKDVAYQSTGIIRNKDLQGLLAYQSYLMNKHYGGGAFDPDIYKALYESLKNLISTAYNIYPNIRSSIRGMGWLNRTGSILIASSDGSMKILSGNVDNRAAQISLAGTGFNNECLGISPDERIAAVGTSGGGLLFIELDNNGEVINQNKENGDIVLFIENLGRSGRFLSAGSSNDILVWDYRDFTSEKLVTLESRPVSIVASDDGLKVMIGTANGKLYTFNINNPSGISEANRFVSNQVRALSFSKGQRYLAAGMLDGSVKILSADGKRIISSLFGPGARVSALGFSPDGSKLVAASNDGNVYMWNALKWGDPPIVYTENRGFVLALCFNSNGNYFYSGSVDYPRMVGRPINPDEMAEDFCSLLTRNLTQDEWIKYFGEDIPYEESCPR
jgi:hypothetical protein